MPIPAVPLRRDDRGDAVASLHRTFESLNRAIEPGERDGRVFGPGTVALLSEFQGQNAIPVTGEFDSATRAVIEAVLRDTAPFTVYGRLRDAYGTPIAGATIRTVDVDLRRYDPLGETTTDSEGEYEVRYSESRFARGEKKSADLVVRALLGGESIAESTTLFNAPLEVRVDLRSSRGQGLSEYARLLAALDGILGDVALAELNDEDVAFLAGDTGEDSERIAILAQAHRMIVPEVPAEAFFGWLVQGLPADLDLLSRESLEALQATLARAAQANIVSAAVGERRGAYARAVFDLQAQRIIESATTADAALRDPWFAQIRSSLGGDRFATFAGVFALHGGEPEALPAKLAENGFRPEEIMPVSNVLALKAISHNHAPLLEALEQAAVDPRLGGLQVLVALGPSDWRALLDRRTTAGLPVGAPPSVPGATPDEKLVNYARLLTAEVESQLPTERFGKLATQDLENPQRLFARERRQDWVRFLNANPDFDLRTSKLKVLLADAVERDRRLDGVSDRAALVRDLESIQRVFRLVPPPLTLAGDRAEWLPLTDRYETVVTLFEAGFHSAISVIMVPEGPFLVKSGVGLVRQQVARHVYMRAAYVGDAALLALLKARSVTDTSPAFASASDYPTLFGTSDLCECEHCRSFLGPAAYFVDTLQFLRDAGPSSNPEVLWNRLSARRPDLRRIALSCANANIELPYLDLVNEVLEDAVAPTPFTPFTLDRSLAFSPIADLDSRHVTDGLRTAFKQSANVIELSHDAEIHLIDVTTTEPRHGKRWFIADHGTLYAIESDEGANPPVLVRWVSRQTRGTTEELVAAPEHVNPGAYERLASGIFPWSLPFDLGWEEIRGLTEQSGLILPDVVVTFEMLGDDPLDTFDALESASAVQEQLAMPEAEMKIVQGVVPVGASPEAYWNVPSGPADWYLALAQVAVLINRAGLSYAELLRLLDSRFVNPVKGVGRTLSIVSIDDAAPATCDLTKLIVDGLDAAVLDRLHRFVRLWRRLGWTISDLDVVLRALGATELTPKVLAEVGHVERLRSTLKLPLDQIAALFANIDAVRYQRHSEEGSRWLPSLYDRVFRLAAGRPRADAVFVEDPGLLAGAIDEQRPAICAALGLDQVSFEALTGSGGALSGPPPHSLTHANLSSLLRHALLARSLGLTPKDLLRVITLVGSTFAGTPRSVWQLVAAATRLADSGVLLDELEFILASRPEVDGRLGRSADDAQRILIDLRQRMLEEGDEALRREHLIRGLASASRLSPALVSKIDRLWASLLVELTVPVPAPSPLPGRDVLLRLDKLGRLLGFAQLPDAEAAWLCERATTLGMPDLLGLPVTPTNPQVPFSAFECVLDFLDARSAARNPLEPLYLVFERAINPASTRTEVVQTLAKATRWSEVDIRWCLTGQPILGPVNETVPNVLRQPATYARMKRALGFARRLGAPAVTVSAIVNRGYRGGIGRPRRPWSTARRAEELTRLVRARRDRAAWLAIATPLNNRLRERRRDALSAYLLHVHPNGLPLGVRSAADLYAYLLVDVEMSACMRTSRIKHAVSTVQLFIQRCLMGFEGNDVRIEPSKAREWTEWRSIFRHSEANRRVFLYPENWLEPELRETRTPFFRELESEVNQAELTAESAERAVRTYLAKLEEVSNLEPVAIHRESQGQGEVLHVVARTTSIPRVHHYRCRTKLASSSAGTWTPWERVDMEIDSEHVMLLVFQARLRLYWASIRDVFSAPTTVNGPSLVTWDIKLFWSEYQAGRWSRRCEVELDGPLTVPSVDGKLPSEAIALRARVSSNGIRIDCYEVSATIVLVPRPAKSTAELADSEVNVSGGSTVHGWVVDRNRVPIPGSIVEMSWIVRTFNPDTKKYNEAPENESVQSAAGYFQLALPEADENALNDPDVTLVASFVNPASNKKIKSSPKVIGNAKVSQNVSRKRSFELLQVELPPAQQTATFWPSVLGVTIDFTDQGIKVAGAGSPLNAHPGTKIAGMGYRHDGSSDFTLLGATISRPWPGFIVPVARLDYDDAEADVYAYRDEREFLLFEKNSNEPSVTTKMGPTAATILRSRVASNGVRALYEAGFPPIAVATNMGPSIDVSFDRTAPEQAYNWEVFFHVPLLVATRFLRARRFADARRWLHFVFDPTISAGSGPERFWIMRPFRTLTSESPGAVRALVPAEPDELTEQVNAMRREPFRPHAIAALRIAAYMRATFFRYMDVLLEWGDSLFRRETIESLNEATQLYVLAQAMLGARTEKVPARALPAPQTFESLTANARFNSELGNAEVEIGELVIPNLTALAPQTPSLGSVALFCFPTNDKLSKYQETVQDRLYKVRHCENIEGSALLLSLWDAPIDPDLLVRATAAGLDPQQFFADLADGPVFRFSILVQKANELCGEVKSFGAALLSSLEKRDAEELSRLRAHHEVELVGRVRSVKQAQLEEARHSKAALEKSLAIIETRGEHYAQLLRGARQGLPGTAVEGGLDALAGSVGDPSMKAAEGTVMLAQEGQDFEALDDAQRAQNTAADWELGAAIAHPFTATAGTPFFSIQTNLGMGFSAVAARYRADAGRRGTESTRLSKQASLVLRAYDWALQLKLAERERTQIKAQILVAGVRETIAERELANHERQIDEVREVERFLRDKYTNGELYDWMIGALSKLYFSSYRLAQGMARRAEAAYRRETGKATSSVIRNDHWDGYYSGLLAGERLSQDLKRLEISYLDDSKRQFEITKHVSLAQVDPRELIRLRETGQCVLKLTEGLFDADYPDHELRRIKAVAVSIPAVVGPYTGVHCTLSVGTTKVRRGEVVTVEDAGSRDIIVTSTGVNDGGLFEQTLRDERFLPFEGAGAVADWTIELGQSQNSFDLKTVADFVLHLRYTSIPPAGVAHAVVPHNRYCLFDLRREFPDAWYRWKNDADPTAKLLVRIDRARVPFTAGGIPVIESVGFFARATGVELDADVVARIATEQRELTVPPAAGGEYGALLYSEGAGMAIPAEEIGIAIGVESGGDFDSLRADVDDLYLVCSYGQRP